MLGTQDILRPNIINISGRRYRQLPIKTLDGYEQQQLKDYGNEIGPYVEDTYYDDDNDEPVTCNNQPEWSVETTSNGYQIIIENLPMFYYRFIIGSGGVKKKDIERTSKARIFLPKIGEQGNVTISGKNKCDVVNARNQIQTVIELHRTEQPATHFICIPLDAEYVSSAFDEFKKKILELQLRGIDGSIFQDAKRLHLTLCLTPFLNDAEVKEVLPTIKDIVTELKSRYLKENCVKILLEGIEYMNDDPGEVDVLYAKVRLPDNSNRLQKFVDELVNALATTGYVKKQYDSVKLHATIMNTLFRKNKRPLEDPNRKDRKNVDRITFDAKKILELYSDFKFGEVSFEQVDISLKGSYDKDGRYKSVVSIPF